jgi:hypothetical protein
MLILLISLIVFILLDSLLPPFTFGSFVLDIAWIAVFFSCINAISDTRKHLAIAALLFAISLGARLAVHLTDDTLHNLVSQSCGFIFTAAFYVYVGFLIAAYVFKDGKVTLDKIAAAICVYLIIGAIWAMLFGLTAILDPGSLRISGDLSVNDTRLNVYFSYITLTTIGYGDITPVSNIARTLAWLEGFIGQIYITVVIARLVGLHIAHSTNRRD